MAELNLKQIMDRLNEEFTGDTRKLVFWYDDKGEFAEDMESVELENAKVYFLQPNNQFYTKYFLERKDRENNYLIYAPFPKPHVKENHLEDTMLYSKRFFADRASMLSVDLGIDEKYKPIIEKHIKFFANKERTQRFYDLEIENFNEENILIGLLCSICKTRTCSFEEVIRVILTGGELQDNKFLTEIRKYDLSDAFWKLCEQHFGYTDVKPTLERFVFTLFVTYTAKHIRGELPKSWKSFVSYKSGNIVAFMDDLMNSVLYRDKYDELSEFVASGFDAVNAFKDYLPEELLNCDTFLCIDRILVKWMADRLAAEDTGAKLDGLSIPEIAKKREKMHFGGRTGCIYRLLTGAYDLVATGTYSCPDGFAAILSKYRAEDYKIDQAYRNFYYEFDRLEDADVFEGLREFVENIYTNEYLDKLLPKWNAGLQEEDSLTKLPVQIDFYSRHIRNVKERTAVIISDAMRYEVGQELFRALSDDPKCTAKLETQLSVLPSYTRLGMAALLPHNRIAMTDDYQVLVDDVLCDNLAGRQTVLKKHSPNSICVQFDDIKGLKKAELRDIFTGKQVIYVYHNQIDARGDKANTEDEVFVAPEAVREDGIAHMSMGTVLRNQDTKVVSFPISSGVFKVAGGGANYVHGGSSPQEMLVPVLNVKMERGHMETKNAEIALVSMLWKITSKITMMDFIQSEPVSDTVKATTYKIFFISEDNEKISNENSYIADSREPNAQKRIFRMKFQFKDKKYDKGKQYYLVVYDENTGLESFRHPIIMDLVFADDFGF